MAESSTKPSEESSLPAASPLPLAFGFGLAFGWAAAKGKAAAPPAKKAAPAKKAPAKPKKKHVNLNKIGREAPAPRKQIKRKAVAESKLKPQDLGPQYPEGMDVPQVPVHDSRLKPKR